MGRRYRLSGGRKVFNALVKALTSLGIPMGNIRVLATTGRKSGQQRSTPVALVVNDAQRWLVSPYGDVGWVQNVRANGRATLRSGRQSETVQLRELQPAEAGPILKTYLERNPITAQFFDAGKSDPVDRFVAEAKNHAVFEISPTRA